MKTLKQQLRELYQKELTYKDQMAVTQQQIIELIEEWLEQNPEKTGKELLEELK